MSLESFFYQHPVFRLDQLVAFKGKKGTVKREHIQQTLQYYLKKKRIISIRRGLFAVVPPHLSLKETYIDPYVLAANTTEDSVLAYHTALELHGIAHTVFQRQTFKTHHKVKPFHYLDTLFQPVIHKDFVQQEHLFKEFTMVTNRNGTDILLTNLECTFVDAIDRPDLCGGWEEVYKCLDGIFSLSITDAVRYCLALKSPILAAKLGYFLERRLEQRQAGLLSDYFSTAERPKLEPLLAYRPKSPYYLAGKTSGSCQYVKKWNLMVPKSHINRTWEEPDHDI